MYGKNCIKNDNVCTLHGKFNLRSNTYYEGVVYIPLFVFFRLLLADVAVPTMYMYMLRFHNICTYMCIAIA